MDQRSQSGGNYLIVSYFKKIHTIEFGIKHADKINTTCALMSDSLLCQCIL